ncbi:sugar ABC transporter substrate-binding protein [Micromonospora sonneratiae]|uniref:Sugar ABC transporter substrate-binding protein n=1 Tax=Micromonospora sonneratiae TaxID=1184706 RepID=A0ABW3YCQ6_9ACTN
MIARSRRLAALLVIGLALAGCTNDTGTAPATGSGSAPVGAAPAGELSFAVVTHGQAGDAFWTVVKTGAEQAGKDLGVKVSYQSSGDPQAQAQLIDAAINQKVNGIVVSMANPDALRSSIQKAISQGIPVVTINSGQGRSAEFGALTHVGQDETVAGEGAGARLRAASVTKLLCVIHEAGNVGLEQRCQGAASALGGQTENLQVDQGNIQAAQSTIQARLQADRSINGVLTLQPAVGAVAVAAVAGAGSSAKVATFDLSDDVIGQIEQGKLLFAVDQQQYLQGYLPVQFLRLYATNANTVGGGKPVLTGPGFVTKENAARVRDLAARGTR